MKISYYCYDCGEKKKNKSGSCKKCGGGGYLSIVGSKLKWKGSDITKIIGSKMK